MTRGDRIVVCVVALAALLAWPMTVIASAGRTDVVTVTGPSGASTVPLGLNRTLDIEGLRGTVRLELADGTVRVTDSTCPDHLCVRQGSISSAGSALVCAPNGVSVRFGGGGHALDAVVR